MHLTETPHSLFSTEMKIGAKSPPEVLCKNSISVCLEAVFLVQKMGNGKGNFNDEMMRHPAENGEPSVLQPSLTTSFSHAFHIDLVMIMNYAFRI